MIKDRVAKGLAFLLDKCPEKVALIDLDKLDMRHIHWCVLGQILGNFWSFNTLGLTVYELADLGFDTDTQDQYGELTLAWKDALNERSRGERTGLPSGQVS